jgi:hypothetical protein
MAKITDERREKLSKQLEPYTALVKQSLEKEKNILDLMARSTAGNSYKKLILCEDMIYLTTLYLAINAFSMEPLGVNNTDALNEGRKTLYKAVIYLEETVTNFVDAPFSEYEETVSQIANTTIEKRYLIIRKLGLAIRMIIDAYGDNTKWKWSFVELNGRFAAVAKNIIDLKAASKIYFDPGARDYETTVNFLRLVKKLLGQSADKYRDRYEFSTHRPDDLNAGINFLLALRRICILTSEADEAEEMKKKALVWKNKMEEDKKKGISK